MRNKLLSIIFFIAIATSSFAQLGKEAMEQVNELQEKYSIKIYTEQFKPSDYALRYTRWTYLGKKDQRLLEKYIAVLYTEWNKYPVDFVKKTKIKAIALVKNMSVQGQVRAAMPDAYGEVLYLDITALKNMVEYIKFVIHHEYYHMIEEQFFGSLYYKDPDWMALNEEGTVYGQGGKYMRNPNDAWKEHPGKGFLDGYSTSGLEEDKANIFAYLMVASYYQKASQWLEEDEIILNKFNYMKNFLKSKSDEFTEEYFDELHQADE